MKTKSTFTKNEAGEYIHQQSTFMIWHALTYQEYGVSRWRVENKLFNKVLFEGTLNECKKFVNEEYIKILAATPVTIVSIETPALNEVYSAIKYTEKPLRFTQEWQKGERIKLIESKEDMKGFIVHNMDYCGNERGLETSFITTELLKTNFTLIN